MQKFNQVESTIAHLELDNVDTDMLIPKQFLKTIKRTGLGKHLFHEMRYDLDGNVISDFVLNKAEFKNSKILLGGNNFGCGSSREHAPWALLDFGIRVVIAPSFADIFYNNCFKNSILPIKLKKSQISQITQLIKTDTICKAVIDLPTETISFKNANISIKFSIDSFRKECLINGLDDISLTMKEEDKIIQFETIQKEKSPWLYNKNTSN